MPTSHRLLRTSLVDMLRCPEDHTALGMADDALLSRLNEAISAGRLRNVAGNALSEQLDGGFVREDRRVVYPIVEGIPRLLVDEGIPLAQLAG